MGEILKISEIFDKNLNFLIGSGASYGALPTLDLNVLGQDGNPQTVETLATHFENAKKESLRCLLFMHYYNSCIRPAIQLDLKELDVNQQGVLDNYIDFLATILELLNRRNSSINKCNIFTTNYDGFFEAAANSFFTENGSEFVVNDGTAGFFKKYLHVKNFNTFVQKTGVFEKSVLNIPQINLVHLHGSVFWRKENENIVVEYHSQRDISLLDKALFNRLNDFANILNNEVASIADLDNFNSNGIRISNFWQEYDKLPVVNPTKWKFHETVFEQHYYQMLRMLSYELEKPNAILVTFGFSFADEHILQIVQRSLSNPGLQLFICCFDENEKARISSCFSSYDNVSYIVGEEDLDFTEFNQKHFSLRSREDS